MDGKPIADMEALVRWRGEDGNLIEPTDFIPFAEETGLIVTIGEWVLQAACSEARRWHRAGRELRVGVNLSARQFRDRNLVATVRKCSTTPDCRHTCCVSRSPRAR